MSRKRSPDVEHTSTLYQKKSKADQQAIPPSTTPVEDPRTLALRQVHKKLKRFYTKPVKSNMPGKVQFINLALVEHTMGEIKTKKDVKDFLEATAAHGIDLQEKNIEYENILTRTGNDSGKRVLISGPPGSGKTTLAHKLCRDLYSGHLPNKYQLVLFTELKAFRSYLNNKEANLVSLLESLGFKKAAADSLCSVIEEEESSGVAIILDGYDEISDDEKISKWASDVFTCTTFLVSECDVFITTRPSQLPQLTKGAYVHLEVLGFSNSNIECYIKAYFDDAPDKAKKVIQRLTDFRLVRGLCSNPRVLDIACRILIDKHLVEHPLPANLSGIFLRYLCYQLDFDLTQRHPPIETERIEDLLSVSEELFPGFYTLCSLAYKCCQDQQLLLDMKELGDVKKYISSRGSVYNLLFGKEVNTPFAKQCRLYQCDHKTVMEALAAVHIAVLSPAKQQQIWEEWFTAPHMAQVWMMYCGLTGLKFVDLRRLCSLTVSERSREVAKDSEAWVLVREDKLVMVSLFEASNDEEAEQVLPVLLKNNITGLIRSQHDVLVLAYCITHHPHLSRVEMDLPEDCSELDLKPLTTSLKNVKAVELSCERLEPAATLMLTVLPRAVEELSLGFGYNDTDVTLTGLAAALRVCHCLQSLRIEARKCVPTVWTELNSVLNSNRLTEFHFKYTGRHDDEPAAPPSMETLNNLFVHREKCSLQMELNDPQLSALLSGLKRADRLKELDLYIDVSKSEVNPNQWLVTCAEVEELVATHPHLVKVDAKRSHYLKNDLLIAVVTGAIRNKNITHLGLGRRQILAVHPLLCSPSADHITSIRAKYWGRDCLDDDAWSKGVIAGPMARQACHLCLWDFTPASLGLLLSRVNTATKLKDLSLEVIIDAVHPLLCSPSADHITSIRAEYWGYGHYYDCDAWSKGVIAGPMARQTCHLHLWSFTAAPLGLLLSRVNTATKLKDFSLEVKVSPIKNHNPVDIRAVETAFMNCNLRKLRIKDDSPSAQCCLLYSAILTGLAANTAAQVDSCIYGYRYSIDVEEITRHLSPQTLQRFEVVRTGEYSFIISRDPSCPSAPVPAPDPLLNTPSQPTSPIAKPETTPPGQATPTHQTTPSDPTPTPPDVGELLRRYRTRILSDVMSRPISNRLEVEKVIDERVALEISKTTNLDGNCLIYLHLMKQGDLKSLQTFCTVLAEEEGNAKMQRLGKDLLAEITLPHGCP